MTPEQIRSYWAEQARAHGTSPLASWSDLPVMDLEIAEISARLADGERVLDVGCANGYSTLQLAARRALALRGLDYIPQMIDSARERLRALPAPLRGSVEFAVGDLTGLQEADGAWDAVVVIRVLINLGSREVQRRGLAEALRVLRPGGRLLLSEATVQGWQRLNALRAEWGLAAIPTPPFNLYLDEDEVREWVGGAGSVREVVNFASSYYVGTRVVKPLLARLAGLGPAFVADASSEWNRWCAALPPSGDYGTQKLFVIERA